ncbi:MAG: acireductone synthase [Hydrogenothermaceae bacterium]|nr:acireductone synthase [Hydrogenothermaceae bacterium]
MDIKAIITDIEGTTTPISFVKDVLFPYSYQKIEEFLKNHWEEEEIKKIVEDIKHIEGRDLSFEEIVNTLRRWIEEDRKITPLKQLQGIIWEDGYKSGELKGYIYPDAYEKLKKWFEKGIKLYVYSSGSVKAQKLLFSHTNYGDLTYLFSGYFDTKIGSKIESESYKKILENIGISPENILFLSDNPEEIKAAAQSGIKVYRLVRPKDAEYIENFPYPQITSFEEINI